MKKIHFKRRNIAQCVQLFQLVLELLIKMSITPLITYSQCRVNTINTNERELHRSSINMDIYSICIYYTYTWYILHFYRQYYMHMCYGKLCVECTILCYYIYAREYCISVCIYVCFVDCEISLKHKRKHYNTTILFYQVVNTLQKI